MEPGNEGMEGMPAEVMCMVFEHLTTSELLRLRTVSIRCKNLVSSYTTRMKERLKDRTVTFDNVAKLEDFCTTAPGDFPVTKFNFRFNPDYETNSNVYRQFASRFGPCVRSLTVKILYVCMGPTEHNLYASLSSLEELHVGDIVQWDDAFLLGAQHLNFDTSIPDVPFKQLVVFSFKTTMEPPLVYFLLRKCIKLTRLIAGQCLIQPQNTREDSRKFYQQGMLKCFTLFLTQRIAIAESSNQTLSFDLSIRNVQFDAVPSQAIRSFVQFLIGGKIRIWDVDAANLDLLAPRQDEGVAGILSQVRSAYGISWRLMTDTFANLEELKFTLDYATICNVVQDDGLQIIPSSYPRLRKLTISCTVAAEEFRCDILRLAMFGNLLVLFLRPNQSDVDSLTLSLPENYAANFVEPAMLARNFLNLRKLDICIYNYTEETWIRFFRSFGQHESLEKLKVCFKTDLTDRLFLGDARSPGSIVQLTNLKHFEMDIILPPCYLVLTHLTDRFLVEGLSKMNLECIKLSFPYANLARFSPAGIRSMTVGQTRLRHFEFDYPLISRDLRDALCDVLDLAKVNRRQHMIEPDSMNLKCYSC